MSQDLDFEVFQVILLILAILVVGNFLRDGKSNYLEGALCVMVYLIIAITTFYYPTIAKPSDYEGNTIGGTTNSTSDGAGKQLAYGIDRGLVPHKHG